MKYIKNLILNKYFKFQEEKYVIEDKYYSLLRMDKEFFKKRELILISNYSFQNPLIYVISLITYISGKIGLPQECQVIPSFVAKDSAAGTIKLTPDNKYFVEINKIYENDKIAIDSIIAHEITHAWLYKYNFQEAEREENEKYTDLMAIFLGLGVLLLNGCWQRTITSRDEDYIMYKEVKPYLTSTELGYGMALFMKQKELIMKDVKPHLNKNALDIVEVGQVVLSRRLKELEDKRNIDSWMIICTNCFQKLRIPAFKGKIKVKCPLCNTEKIFNSNSF
ncbi:MAG: hypothetical protein V1833_00215 [Elusimicrobiota bacterium]